MGVGGGGGSLIFKNPSFILFKLNKGEIKIKLPKIKNSFHHATGVKVYPLSYVYRLSYM